MQRDARLGVFLPYTVVCIIPALAGLVGDRYLSKCKYDLQIGTRYFLIGGIANALLTPAVFWLGGVLLAFQNRGRFMPLSFLAGIFVSPGFALPPLVFMLVAIVAYRLRRFWSIPASLMVIIIGFNDSRPAQLKV